jgi:hypothetical protein
MIEIEELEEEEEEEERQEGLEKGRFFLFHFLVR